MKTNAPIYSFEFFPPKTAEGMSMLEATSQALAALKPGFFSVTFGAGGSTRDRTFETVINIRKKSGIEVAPHLSCISSTRENIREILNTYRDDGIRHMVALRGDIPSGTVEAGEFRYANELVTFIREETGDHFHIEVAAYPEYHPQASSPDRDFANFRRKVEAGANSAITQYFYNPDAFFRFTDCCKAAGIDIPVVPGIMPITNYYQLARFSDSCGAEIPRWIRKRLEAYGEDLES
ncbi:MAG: methylenetetrahydrofolate reductase, partial [Gammaproteobacteria bacterium]|nr:methylenetetrahydrofolate reductase [Gammaproteobacteria bacterium]